MARRRRGKRIDGWLAVDKPAGMTSTAVVTEVRRLSGAAKVGHGGTLDPLATGVLPLAFGEATKTVSYVMDGPKTYRWTVRWGEARSTDDAEGAVIATSDKRPSAEEIEAALPRFIGEIEQVPPAFSAVKVDGERAYDLARADRPVALKPRRVRIDAFRLLGIPDPDHAEFEVRSGKGAYIRSLARDLAEALGTRGHVAALRRTSCGPFGEDRAIPLSKLRDLGHSSAFSGILLSVETALADIPALAVTEAEARQLANGQGASILRIAAYNPGLKVAPGMTVRAMENGRLVALARVEGGEVRPVRVMNLKRREQGDHDVDHA